MEEKVNSLIYLIANNTHDVTRVMNTTDRNIFMFVILFEIMLTNRYRWI